MKKYIAILMAVITLLSTVGIPVLAAEAQASGLPVKDIVITPSDDGGARFNSIVNGSYNTRNGGYNAEVTVGAFKGENVFLLPCDSSDATVYTGVLNISNVEIPVDDYAYVKIKLFYAHTGGHTPTSKTPRLNYVGYSDGGYQWCNKSDTNNNPSPMRPLDQTVKDYMGKWGTLIIPIDKESHAGKVLTEIEVMLLDYTMATGTIYIQSVCISNSDDTVVEDITITADNYQAKEVEFNKNEQNNGLTSAGNTVQATAFDRKNVLSLSCKAYSNAAYGGVLNISNLGLPVDDYAYVKIKLYCDGTHALQGKNILFNYADGWVTPMQSKKMVSDFLGKWDTVVIPIDQETHSGNIFDQIELLLVGHQSFEGTLYIESVTFSANADVIDDDIISAIGLQNKDGANNAVRFVSVLKISASELANYSKVGYELVAEYMGVRRKWTVEGNTVYTSIYAANEFVNPSNYGGTYFLALNLTGLPDIALGWQIDFTVKPYVVKNSGECVYGASMDISVDNPPYYDMVTDEYSNVLEAQAQEMRDAILNNTPEAEYIEYAEKNGKTVYYVSSVNGNDSNDGLSAEEAWQTLTNVNKLTDGSDAVVLFECGSTFRGTLWARSEVIYSHYGDTAKGLPVISGSRQNYANSELWVETEEGSNIYRLTVPVKNVGVIVFNPTMKVGSYSETVATMLFNRENSALTYTDLDKDLQFFCDIEYDENGSIVNKSISVEDYSDTLYLYSENGNPGERFNCIEIGENKNAIALTDNIIIDGLRVVHVGGIAISGSDGMENTVIKNCIVEWSGGSKLNQTSTFGNAIQLYGSVDNCKIDNNWCYQIYDTGVTVQYAKGGTEDITMKNTSMSGNLIEYCFWGIEYWNQQPEPDTYSATVQNITIDNNFIRYTGYGWGGVENRYEHYSKGIAEQSAAICSFGLPTDTSGVSVSNNVLQYAHQSLIRMDYYGGENDIRMNNTYIQYEGNLLFKLHEGFGEKTDYRCDRDAGTYIYYTIGDTEYTLMIKNKDVDSIYDVTADNRYFIGTTDKEAVSYTAGEDITFTVKLYADEKNVFCPYFKYSLSSDDGNTDSGFADGRSGTFTLTTKITRPGFVYLKVEACDENKNPISNVAPFNGGAGADISSITKTKSEPADFDEFWNTQLAWLDEVEPQLVSCEKYTFSGAVAGYDYYIVKIKFHEDAEWGDYVSAYLTVPQNALPDSLDLHVEYNGAGVSDLNKYHSSNAALLNVAAHSMELGQSRDYYLALANGKLKDYGFNPEYNSSRDTVYFKEMILRDIQAVRFMRKYFAADGPSFTFTDGTGGSFAGLGNGKVNLAGGSQGGFQCMAVAALDDGIDYQIAYCPWLSDIGGYGVDGTQTSDFMPEYTEALEYFDSINFAKRVKCRTMIKTVGLGDTTTPPKGITALYNVLANNGNNVKVDITYWQNRTHSYTAPSGTYDSITVKNY